MCTNTCSICLDEIDDNKNICKLECGHVLHTSCLCSNFIFKRYCCPLCKRNIVDEEIIKRENTNNINNTNVNYLNQWYSINYEVQLENKRLRQSQYKNYPILKKMYKEVLLFKRLLKDSKKMLINLNRQLLEQNKELVNKIKENKKIFKSHYQKYLRREKKFILKANDILNIHEDVSIF